MYKVVTHPTNYDKIYLSTGGKTCISLGDIHSGTFKDLNRIAIYFTLTCFMAIIKHDGFRDWRLMFLWTRAPGCIVSVAQNRSFHLFKISPLSPCLCSFFFFKVKGKLGGGGVNKMNPHQTKGTRTALQPRIVSEWMIIWLISEINNNNCLSLLIRALNSKWNPSAELQRAGLKHRTQFWVEKKETQLYIAEIHVGMLNLGEQGISETFRIFKAGLG